MKILIIQTAFFGDSVLSTALIPPLRKKYPDAEIHILTTPQLSPIFQLVPDITVISVPKNKSLANELQLIKQIRAQKYSIVICPHRSMRSAIITAASGAKIKIGFAVKLNGLFFNAPIKYEQSKHEVYRFFDLLKPLNIQPDQLNFPFRISREADLKLRKVLPDPYIVIAPGSVWFTKRWPVQNFAKLTQYLINDKQHIVLVGSKDEESICKVILSQNDNNWIYNLCGKTTIEELFAIIKNAKLLITNDSAPLHIASALNTPTAAIFGSTIPSFGFYPLAQKSIVIEVQNLPCRPCKNHGLPQCPKGHFRCMLDITPEYVLKKLKTADLI